MPQVLQEKQQFAADIMAGLSKTPKTLPSRYFYDAAGDELFRRIMALPEYYLTRCEFEIFKLQADKIIANVAGKQPLQLIELGAGDGSKTILLLKQLQSQQIDFTYYPIDISGNALEILCTNIDKELHSAINIQPIEGEYFEALASPLLQSGEPKLILFLGSNIGNFKGDESVDFVKQLAALMKTGDQILVGYDLKKDPFTILSAYNDSQGVTREFNFNLLKRINRELGADFNLEAFLHFPVYDPLTGAAKSYLVSKEKQEVSITTTGQTVTFNAYEPVFMEISQKFDERMIRELGEKNGLTITHAYKDSKGYFSDVLYQK